MGGVLVAVITYAGQAYCRDIFFRSLQNITYEEKGFLFVTNSGEDDKKDLQERARAMGGATVVTNDLTVEHKYDHLVNNRNIARDHFLAGEWEWMFFLDSDVLCPTNTIEALLQHGKNIVSGVYLSAFEHEKGKPRILPVLYVKAGQGTSRQLSLLDVIPDRLIPISSAGLGCCLIHRSMIEAVKFRRAPHTTEDTYFFLDARTLDEQPYADTRVKCWHLKYPQGDERNKLLDFRNYRMNLRRKQSQ